ncbi:MAG: hypothetical protein US83_C0004G0071 [Candidatus Falkowbacteria bacterium GW2011_GWC2_38_22]|uniref:Copper-sensing transcriptional repressor CsoR n=1 Tax=Candidatus Falkowbacteria bacterium GW2011_GWE1_38_31 TaxID=1618638 RepID=A0A0G0N0B9_9BACT|nr:MAG: hypothetical protein US73_C0002G0046 [Candidatus Falkowbacteria bacterium GW2011_GWF2_38_1205]KKQ61687.1 MAG: hypothetical protein US83_C0004G0071 [Candidatus Falkowbacteria bacterium GW2011_GWC2_38_22]KKQ63698.1 MAG: hypothetical protein US84_C0004G0046 [Candidatus Falkowbacteria bacterium GW2011_GWF1_38_22]KKQ65886.1 MAG: hypothetical protein US87_C0004G0071 [Candidatus Falkowbacteria bacterium GW2011_GWE2_38_254]KKQ70561.1 MAG: hypothetical protein US91_C0004G0046 [Candidatus Falkowb
MKTQEQLINNIIGQLNGINRMIEEKKDCFSVIVQMKAVKSALNSLTNKYIEENFVSCLDSCGSRKKSEMIKKLVLELTKNN